MWSILKLPFNIWSKVNLFYTTKQHLLNVLIYYNLLPLIYVIVIYVDLCFKLHFHSFSTLNHRFCLVFGLPDTKCL